MADLIDRYEQMYKDALEKRVLIFNQDVDDCVIEDFVSYIIKWNIEDDALPVDKRNKIKILMNSCGGDSVVGFGLIDVIKSSKTPVVAVGVGLVASMAFHIFIGCKERYAFENTVLLMHDGAIDISNSSSKAKDTMAFLDKFEARTKEYVIANTAMDEKFYDDHYEQELYMYADKAKELGCLDGIIGIDIDLEDAFR